MDNGKTHILVSFNGEYTYDSQANRWNHVNGMVFSLFVPMNIRLNTLLDTLYTKLGIDRHDSKLGIKALFTYNGMGMIPAADISDDETLNGYIEETSRIRNVTFCVNATPVEDFDLNEDYSVPDENNNSDYRFESFPTEGEALAGDPFEDMYGVETFPTQRLGEASEYETGRPSHDFSNQPYSTLPPAEMVSQYSAPSQYQPFSPSHQFPHQPSSSIHAVEMVSQYSAPFQFGPSTFDVINSQSYHPGQYPSNQPSSSRAPAIQQPQNLFGGGSVTSYFASMFAPPIQPGQTDMDNNINRGTNARARVPEPFEWRVPTIEDGDLPRCITTGTLDVEDADKLFIGKRYDSKEDFDLKIKLYAVANHFQMSLVRSDTTCLHYKCYNPTCKWSVRARKTNINMPPFRIKTLHNEHTCLSQNPDNRNRCSTPLVVANLLSQKMEELGNKYKPHHICEDMLTNHNVKLTYDQAYQAHEMMRNMIRGSPNQSYSALPSYLHVLREANEGTYTDFRVDNLGRFCSCFMSLGASRRGFKYCRPILCVDATHLKTRFQGQLFAAVAVDAGDHLFPVAFGIAEKECNDAWVYFMTHLRAAIEGSHDERLSFISDRHKSIRHAVEKVFPGDYHGVCYHHLKGNLSKYEGFCEDTFYQAAYTFSKTEFRRKYDMIKAQCPTAYAKLEEITPERWTRSNFPGKRYAIMTSNYAESFNCVIRGARRWPVPSLLEFIRQTLQSWYHDRRESALQCASELAPEIEQMVAANISAIGNFRVRPVNRDEFEVRSNNMLHGVVNIQKRTCYCGAFEGLEIPCKHAVAAAAEHSIRPDRLCSRYYKAEYFKQIYMGSIYPVPNKEDWDIPEALRNTIVGVPNARYAPNASGAPRRGRVNTTRMPSEWERPVRQVLCGNCHHPGHNSAGCTQYH